MNGFWSGCSRGWVGLDKEHPKSCKVGSFDPVTRKAKLVIGVVVLDRVGLMMEMRKSFERIQHKLNCYDFRVKLCSIF